jgi:hypothetical protein
VKNFVVEVRAGLGEYLVRDVAIEEICRDRENMSEVASGRLEVESRELTLLVDVDVG